MSIAENIARVEEQVASACRRSNRSRTNVRIMAVSKTHPATAILEAYECGLRLFGENRVQEYAGKHPPLVSSGIFAQSDPTEFHCIGPLQSNKVTRAVGLFDGVDSVDSIRVAEKLDQSACDARKTLSILVEIKLGTEDSKHGLLPQSNELAQLMERLPDLHHLQVRGLMTIPPYTEDQDNARPYFRQLQALRASLSRRYPQISLDDLSMGMSHDFPIAIEEGATIVRIGTAIFGSRPKPIPTPSIH